MGKCSHCERQAHDNLCTVCTEHGCCEEHCSNNSINPTETDRSLQRQLEALRKAYADLNDTQHGWAERAHKAEQTIKEQSLELLTAQCENAALTNTIKKVGIEAYSTGYNAGHHDTVESIYCDDALERAEEWCSDELQAIIKGGG